jgi:enamine deaminase RidA (YjgF/YER057c/UK114 family)
MTHDRFQARSTKGRWPGQDIDYQIALAVRARGRHLFLGGLTGLDLDGRLIGLGDPATQADQAMRNLRILLAEADADLSCVCKVTTYLLDRAHREPVYNTVARHLSGVRPCGTGLIVSGLAIPEMLVEFDVDVVVPD